MVLDKKQDINVLTSDQLDKASVILKAIAHPMRIAILNQLDGGKELSVTEIHESLGIEQAAASHHLGILKDKGVLSSRRDGKNTYYFIRNENLLGIIDCISKCACF
jgi:DNA-binding transcriptional ArsR family regulator